MRYKLVTTGNIHDLVKCIKSKNYVVKRWWFNYYIELPSLDEANVLASLVEDIGRGIIIIDKEMHIGE